ncbi:MAG: hypothetical protein HYR60_10965 [Acidobacteria bacterium]|nr:hypothetical protein [Acidobacteriota bacterium]
MNHIRLIHWNSAEAEQLGGRLRGLGYDVVHGPVDPLTFRGELRRDPPAAFVISLDRLPSHGREVALSLRQSKATRRVPLVFAGGEPEKVERTRKVLPDALYTSWGRIGPALARAIAHPPADPVSPGSMAGYAGTPLPKKLGIRANTVVGMAGPPRDFRKTLGNLPEGVVLRNGPDGPCDLLLWFTRSRRELEGEIERMAALAASAPLWIIWPKKASGIASDLTQQQVREIGLATGLVDYKICAIDQTWAGLLFRRRKR